MSWTLRDANGVEKSGADWGVTELARMRVNQQADTLTFRAAGRGSDADPLLALGSTVQLFNGGAPWFYGRVVEVPGRATGAGEDQLYKLAGPWWYLENLVFQQVWEMTNGVTTALGPTNLSRIILGQAADGVKLATGAAILEVLNYAIAQGAPLTVGTITPNAIAPYAEALDESCAEIIRKFLRWTPDAIAAFDYTTSPYPTLSIVQRSSAASVTLPAYGAPASGLELTPRNDLQTPCVQLKFEQTDDIDGDTFTTLTEETAPTGATGSELGALVMTVDLAGARATYHSQAITTGAIPSSDATTSAVLWWQGKFAWLNDFAATDLTVVSGTQTSTIENPAGYPGVSASDLPNELLSGSISAWMNFQSAPLRVQATLQYTGADTDESTDVFGSTKQRVVYTRVIGTNADSGTYKRLTSATQAEPAPIGLAAAIYAATSVLQYDGVLELTEQECSGVAVPGQLLNLSGGRAEWTTMAAQIQRVEELIDTGVTRITIGPAKHLGVRDLNALLRVNRTRRPSYRLGERTSGEASGNAAQVIGGEQQPRSDSIVRPSSSGSAAVNQPFQLLNVSDATGLKVKVNENSFLQQSLTPNDLFAITGLDTPVSVSPGTMVWLEVDFATDGATVTAASIGNGSGGWSGYPTPFTFTGTSPNQVLASAFVLIGYIAAASSTLDGASISGGPSDAPVTGKIIQCVTQPLLLRAGVFNGVAMVLPLPAPRALLEFMKLTYCEYGSFPFLVPEKDASFASSVGPQTVYPAGFSLDQAMQIYWRAQNYALTATGNGVLGQVTQALSATGNLPSRNAMVGTASFSEVDGLPIPSPTVLAAGVGLRRTIPGAGTITASGSLGNGTNTAALFNLLIDLFYPEVYAPDPMIKYAGQWWPAMSLSCAVTNTVNLDSGGTESIEFDCTTLPDPSSTTEIGTFSFFGVSVPVYCQPLAPGDGPDAAETRTFAGSLTVAGEWT